MRKIILASGSKARRALLRKTGLRFHTIVPEVKESRRLKGGCSRLVIANALRKAKTVSKGLKSGIVIGADTVVLANKRVIGKPKNKRDAFKILRLLSGKQYSFYTGIVVIDIDRNKTFTAYEVTRVYMKRLSNDQIQRYLRSTSNLYRAGAFDVQGRGLGLVRRIEGCYNNVAGLPLVKLAKLLKKVRISI